MQIASERAQRKLDCTVRIFDPGYMSKDIVSELGFGPLGHAEEIESSHMLSRYPELVDIAQAMDNPIEYNELYSVDPSYRKDTLCYVPSSYDKAKINADNFGGVSGSPSKASVSKGEKYHNHLVMRLVDVIRDLQ